MLSTVLAQRPKEDAHREACSDLGNSIISVESNVDHIRLETKPGKGRDIRDGKFCFDAEMTECGRAEDNLKVRYSLSFGKVSSGQLCEISGDAVFRLSGLNPESDLRSLDPEVYSEMAVEIFRRNYEVIYLLHRTLGADIPSPWITQDVRDPSPSAASPMIQAVVDS